MGLKVTDPWNSKLPDLVNFHFIGRLFCGAEFDGVKPWRYISPIANGWLSESTTVHVFRYHAQDSGKREVKKAGGTGKMGHWRIQVGVARRPTPKSFVAPLPSIFFKTFFKRFWARCLPQTVSLDPSLKVGLGEASKRTASSTSGLSPWALERAE